MENIGKKESSGDQVESLESERRGDTVITSNSTIIEKCSNITEVKSDQKISPPKKRAPKLCQIGKSPSIEKAGKQIFMSQEILEDPGSFDFGDLSSVSDGENGMDITVLDQNQTINA